MKRTIPLLLAAFLISTLLSVPIQAAEAVKLLLGRPSSLEGQLLLADLRRMDWDLLPL